MKKKLFLWLFILPFLLLPMNYVYGADDCLSLLNSVICVGETHDSVISKLDKKYTTGQVVTNNPYGPVVSRDYDYHGDIFTLTFGRTSRDSPHRLLKIEKRDPKKSKEISGKDIK